MSKNGLHGIKFYVQSRVDLKFDHLILPAKFWLIKDSSDLYEDISIRCCEQNASNIIIIIHANSFR